MDVPLGQALLAPHRSYLQAIRPLLAGGSIKGLAHITGGGITENLPRVLPAGTHAVIDRSAWRVPPIFSWLQQAGAVPEEDMLRTFNMGIGMIAVVDREAARQVLGQLVSAEEDARTIGTVESGGGGVLYR
jgi:phosphoribosylformylglycinamidine cyclo-ligase